MGFSLFRNKDSFNKLTPEQSELFEANRAAFHKALGTSLCPYPDQTKEQISFYQKQLKQLTDKFQQASSIQEREALNKRIASIQAVIDSFNTDLTNHQQFNDGQDFGKY